MTLTRPPAALLAATIALAVLVGVFLLTGDAFAAADPTIAPDQVADNAKKMLEKVTRVGFIGVLMAWGLWLFLKNAKSALFLFLATALVAGLPIVNPEGFIALVTGIWNALV